MALYIGEQKVKVRIGTDDTVRKVESETDGE